MMAVIRAGRTRLIKAGIVGAVISLVPAVMVCGMLIFNIAKKDSKLNEANTKLDKYKSGTVCVLKNDVEKGQEITLKDIEKIKGTFYENELEDSEDNYIGKVMQTEAKAGTVLNDCIVSDAEESDDSLRTYYIDYIDIPNGFAEGLSFDIRVAFPNGEDYLVATNKKFSVRD